MTSEESFRRIWRQAIRANRELCLDRPLGERTFVALLRQYPKDGMVYYSRAEAYEYLGELDLAERDYREAEAQFPVPHWKAVARLGLERVRETRSSGTRSAPGSDQWSVFHRIYQVPRIPDDIRGDALSAVARFDTEAHLTAVILRACLEELIWRINPRLPEGELEICIDSLTSHAGAPTEVHDQMHLIRKLGNEGAHSRRRRRNVDFRPILPAFAGVLEWADSFLSRAPEPAPRGRRR